MAELPNYISPEKLLEMRDKGAKLHVIDVRKMPAFKSSGMIIPGAVWRDHEQVEQWGAAYHSEELLIAYCVHGHEVSQNTVAKLLSMGAKALYLQGGFDAWLKAGGKAIESGQTEG